MWSYAKVEKCRRLLLGWYERHRRKLPWRDDPNPYKVWVSEIMLQQTQVQTVLPYFEKFMMRFPNVKTLASAVDNDVFSCWAGLGYYSRARNLLLTARRIVADFDGKFPERFEDMIKLPGIGRYTAGAISSIAFNQAKPVVDGNVRRVISRLQAIEEAASESFFWEEASRWVPERRASQFNQAIMELGALVCIPSQPHCLVCPLQAVCEARKRGIERTIPRSRRTRAAESVALVIVVIQCRGKIFLTKEAAIPYIPGEWALPTEPLAPGISPQSTAADMVGRSLGRAAQIEAGPVLRHAITYRRIRAHVFRAEAVSDKRGHWATRQSAERLLTSSLFRKAMRSV